MMIRLVEGGMPTSFQPPSHVLMKTASTLLLAVCWLQLKFEVPECRYLKLLDLSVPKSIPLVELELIYFT